jgi:branched-chain amino acid transport system substrate-binding protein
MLPATGTLSSEETMSKNMTLKVVLCSAAIALGATSTVWAQTKPAALRLGITTFLTGSASVFGIPGKAAAELWIGEFNAKGGIDGVKLAPVFIDEGLRRPGFFQTTACQEDGESHALRDFNGNCTVAPSQDLKVSTSCGIGTEKF